MCFIRRHCLHRISDDANDGKCLHGCSGFMYCKWGHSAGFCCLFKHTLHDNQLTCKDNFLYETCFSDDEQDFLLYRGEEDEPCAVCSLDYENGFTNLYGVYVDEDCRGQGIGTLLLAHLIPAYFKNHNLPLILNVRSTNTAAMQLYRHCGFEITSSVEFSYFTALPQ